MMARLTRESTSLDHITKKDEDLQYHFDQKAKLRKIAVSTDDFEVRMQLREFGQPICCFGEDAADRRERLRHILGQTDSVVTRRHKQELDKTKEKEDDNVVWYHEGSDELRDSRYWITHYYIIKSRNRLRKAREYFSSFSYTQRKAKAQEYQKKLRGIESVSTTTCDVRPVISCQFSPCGDMLATASWSGDCKIFTVPNMDVRTIFKGHQAKMSSVTWNPQSGKAENAIDLATSDHDGIVKLWSLQSIEPVGFIEGHEPYRVAKLDFHPSGRFLATSCFDQSWRLWDLSTGEEILHQEGHSKEVYDVSFHPEGMLLLSGDLHGFGRVWDLRSGRCIFFLEGHAGGIMSTTWSDNGHQMATGSIDNTAKIWDLRERKCVYTISAHQHSVSSVKFQPGHSHFIHTASYDRTNKLWAHPTWTPIKEMAEHTEKIMASDISGDCKYIATCSYDRQVKLWQIPQI